MVLFWVGARTSLILRNPHLALQQCSKRLVGNGPQLLSDGDSKK